MPNLSLLASQVVPVRNPRSILCDRRNRLAADLQTMQATSSEDQPGGNAWRARGKPRSTTVVERRRRAGHRVDARHCASLRTSSWLRGGMRLLVHGAAEARASPGVPRRRQRIRRALLDVLGGGPNLVDHVLRQRDVAHLSRSSSGLRSGRTRPSRAGPRPSSGRRCPCRRASR